MTGSAGRAGRFKLSSSSSLREEVQEERGARSLPDRDPGGFLGVVFFVFFRCFFRVVFLMVFYRFFDDFLMFF